MNEQEMNRDESSLETEDVIRLLGEAIYNGGLDGLVDVVESIRENYGVDIPRIGIKGRSKGDIAKYERSDASYSTKSREV